jgi:uncharacterized protein YbbK (DUF523 family)
MIRVGVSACLLGERVRHDGGHKRTAALTEVLAHHFTWIAVCPEMEIGLGTPREPVHLVGAPDAPLMVGVTSGRDLTAAMTAHARCRARELLRLDIAGYVLKSASPSCGLRGVPVRSDGRGDSVPGRGLFAAALVETCPGLPVVEEGDLVEAAAREAFIARVHAFAHRPRDG